MNTIIECMCGIAEKMRNPRSVNERLLINVANTEKAAIELGTLRETLGLNSMQVLILIAIIRKSSNNRIDADDVASYLGMDYLQFLSHDDDMQELRKRGYIRINNDGRITVPGEALKKLKANKPVEPEPVTKLSTGKILLRIKKMLAVRKKDEMTAGEVFDELTALVQGNPKTSISRACDKYLKHVDNNEAVVFFALIYLYWYRNDDMVDWYDLEDYFDEDELDELQIAFRTENMDLQTKGVIEYAGKEGVLTKEYFRIKDAIKSEIFDDVGGIRKKDNISASRKLAAGSIARKELFYNASEGGQVAQLKDLLSDKSFEGIRTRMKEKGFRSGFTCLFYGSPGTGKTETVYQIARESGRDLFFVDVSQVKSCWVGESEKNIKDVFDKYRECVRGGGLIPILLFNEADAIFGIRQQGAEKAVDKMENSLQNIILQEMEDLDGILIATTNLTENLDKAFERRFLYKIRFDKPSVQVKRQIWKSMMPDITDADATYLAGQFDLSGGQIENVARKKTIQGILSGNEPTVEDLVKYCSEEEIGAEKGSRRIGF